MARSFIFQKDETWLYNIAKIYYIFILFYIFYFIWLVFLILFVPDKSLMFYKLLLVLFHFIYLLLTWIVAVNPLGVICYFVFAAINPIC